MLEAVVCSLIAGVIFAFGVVFGLALARMVLSDAEASNDEAEAVNPPPSLMRHPSISRAMGRAK